MEKHFIFYNYSESDPDAIREFQYPDGPFNRSTYYTLKILFNPLGLLRSNIPLRGERKALHTSSISIRQSMKSMLQEVDHPKYRILRRMDGVRGVRGLFLSSRRIIVGYNQFIFGAVVTLGSSASNSSYAAWLQF